MAMGCAHAAIHKFIIYRVFSMPANFSRKQAFLLAPGLHCWSENKLVRIRSVEKPPEIVKYEKARSRLCEVLKSYEIHGIVNFL